MTPEQKQRLRHASLCPTPISARTTPKHFAAAREAVFKALKGRNLEAGLRGAVFIEACQCADRYLVRTPKHGSA
jgi:hypothetical protein